MSERSKSHSEYVPKFPQNRHKIGKRSKSPPRPRFADNKRARVAHSTPSANSLGGGGVEYVSHQQMSYGSPPYSSAPGFSYPSAHPNLAPGYNLEQQPRGRVPGDMQPPHTMYSRYPMQMHDPGMPTMMMSSQGSAAPPPMQQNMMLQPTVQGNVGGGPMMLSTDGRSLSWDMDPTQHTPMRHNSGGGGAQHVYADVSQPVYVQHGPGGTAQYHVMPSLSMDLMDHGGAYEPEPIYPHPPPQNLLPTSRSVLRGVPWQGQMGVQPGMLKDPQRGGKASKRRREDGSRAGSPPKLPPGRRRKHICTPDCNHVCVTPGCNEMLTAAAARSRYVRCARCRKLGLSVVSTGPPSSSKPPINKKQMAAEQQRHVQKQLMLQQKHHQKQAQQKKQQQQHQMLQKRQQEMLQQQIIQQKLDQQQPPQKSKQKQKPIQYHPRRPLQKQQQKQQRNQLNLQEETMDDDDLEDEEELESMPQELSHEETMYHEEQQQMPEEFLHAPARTSKQQSAAKVLMKGLKKEKETGSKAQESSMSVKDEKVHVKQEAKDQSADITAGSDVSTSQTNPTNSTTPRKKPQPPPLTGPFDNFNDFEDSSPEPSRPQVKQEPDSKNRRGISSKGRVRVPARIFSPSGASRYEYSSRPAASSNRSFFSFDDDAPDPPRRPSMQLHRGSPRIAKVFSPLPDLSGDDEPTYTEKDEPRVYISPAPNWFHCPPAGVSADLIAKHIETYKKSLPSEGLDDKKVKVEGKTGEDSWTPSEKAKGSNHPAVALSKQDDKDVNDGETRSESVTVGLHDSDDSEHVDKEIKVKMYNDGDFDRDKCRKCQINFDNDEDDLLQCQVCSAVFHAGCEEPPLKWSPTEVFCSPFCFEAFESGPSGRALFSENAMLASGHLRKYSECLANEDVDGILSKSKLEPERTWAQPFTIPELDLEIGQCVSLRAEPRSDDPRLEWPAIIRKIFYHRSGYPLFFVTWLDPINPDKKQYAEVPGGAAQTVPCHSPSCPSRVGYKNWNERSCYSVTCRQRSNPLKKGISEVKPRSRLRIAMTAADIEKEKEMLDATGASRTNNGQSNDNNHTTTRRSPSENTHNKQLLNVKVESDGGSETEHFTDGDTDAETFTDFDTGDDTGTEFEDNHFEEDAQEELEDGVDSTDVGTDADEGTAKEETDAEQMEDAKDEEEIDETKDEDGELMDERKDGEEVSGVDDHELAVPLVEPEAEHEESGETIAITTDDADDMEEKMDDSEEKVDVKVTEAMEDEIIVRSEQDKKQDDTNEEESNPVALEKGSSLGKRSNKSRRTRARAQPETQAEVTSPVDTPPETTPPQRAAKSKSSSGKDSSKRAIVCSCGRVFANGQALGGHRGKCKVPRERMRQSRADGPGGGSTITRAKAPSAGKSKSRSTKPRSGRSKPSRSNPKPPPTSEASQAARYLARLRQKGKPKKTRNIIGGKLKPMSLRQQQVRPVYPILPFHPKNYKIGSNERRPQAPACIVKIHPFKFQLEELPENFLTAHRDLAKSKFTQSKLDDMQTDRTLNGPYDLPETNKNKAVLSYSREVPRRLFGGDERNNKKRSRQQSKTKEKAKEKEKETSAKKKSPIEKKPAIKNILSRETRASTPTPEANTSVTHGTRRTSRPRSVIPTNLVVEVMKSKPASRRRDSVVVEVRSKSRRDSISPTLGSSGPSTRRSRAPADETTSTSGKALRSTRGSTGFVALK
eukprot:m.341430 g.341430  ORF g.341430 m.341430 type:complete len:1703 (+) comp20106_c0_seq1:375-5483(+)